MVVGTTGALAVRAGYEALLCGGSAADAALTTAITQVVLAGGAWVSYGGVLTLVYYEAQTGKVYSMNAGFDIPLGEADPATIPSDAPSGRTALVPGFMAGVEAAHKRFGKLTFSEIFIPAIYFAENGYDIDPMLAGMIQAKQRVLGRLPETKAIFTDSKGRWLTKGDRLRQPEVAKSLQAIAKDGAAHMYSGPWAHHFVEIVQREGGKVSLEDMANYKAIWSEPRHTEYHGFDVFTLGFPSMGGVDLIEALNVAGVADLRQWSDFRNSPQGFFWTTQTGRLMSISFLDPKVLALVAPGVDLTPESRVNKPTAQALWLKMQTTLPLTTVPSLPKHSDAVVAIDQRGDIAALVHSINTDTWGNTGIFVDGISIPDSARFQQQLMARTGPGKRLPDPTDPLIVLREGRPVLACGSIGAGLHQKTLEVLLDILDRGADLDTANKAPSTGFPAFNPNAEQVLAGSFSGEVLAKVRAMGLTVRELSNTEWRLARGYLVGVAINPTARRLTGSAAGGLNGYAVGE